MFADITLDRLLAMSEQELRWFENVKKAFYESDRAYAEGRPQDHCFPELCKAVDTAKTLRRSLRNEDTSCRDNKKRFVEFLNSTSSTGSCRPRNLGDCRFTSSIPDPAVR